MQIITTLDSLDAKLAECHAAALISDDALRHEFTTFRMDISPHVPADPFSSEYHDFQMEIYKRISGREYSPKNEISTFDVAAADRRPFPFYTNSCRTAGFFTMGMGFLLHTLDLPAGARVVEFGAGWGNTTIAMAMAGLDMTAVDIEANFCELLRRRAKRHDVDVTVIHADFMWAETVTAPFDAGVFFECFHHCSDHMRLLQALRTAIKPGGRVYFAAEPISPDFPLPWGLRMDGESLWAIRSNGWMEVGYRESYFREALARTGWTASRHVLPGLEWASVWEAKRIDGSAPRSEEYAVESQPPAVMSDASQGAENCLRAELDAVYSSTSWRVTAPLRAFRRSLRGY
jgi:2-polyprenyl-3-methyl-5-hydroxy-6-metoxy-1,4-benzoquinol methylase